MMARSRAWPTLGLAVILAGSATTSGAASSPDAEGWDEAAAEIAAELAAERDELASVVVTDAMRDDATMPLDAAGSTFALDPADATVEAVTEVEEADDTVVTLTADLLFGFDSAELSDRAAQEVRDVADGIPRGATVAVDGHTDAVGSDADNQELSEERAQAVADVLGDARSDLTLEVRGHGESDPVADNTVGGKDNPAGRALNRRVEVTYPSA